jgi:hypothetical protein
MSQASVPVPTARRFDRPDDISGAAGALLSGRWLVVARAVWVTLTAFFVAFFVANLPVYFDQMRMVCLHPDCAPWQLTPARAHALAQIHLSPTSYAVLSLVLSVFCGAVWFAVAAVIAWRRSREWLALLTSLLLIAQCIVQLNASATTPLEYNDPVWYTPTAVFNALGIALFVLVFSLFPSGRFAPRWMRWAVAMVPAVFWAYWSIAPSSASMPAEVSLYPLAVGVTAGLLCTIMGAQIYRYRRVSTPVERQQTRWVVLGVVEGPLVGIVYFSLPVLFPALGQPDSHYYLLARPIYNLLWLFAPICFGIAILRYHLWDIDVLIRRTLVYGTLTAVVAALYFGVVIGAQAVVQPLTGQRGQEPLVIVATTLLIAALFNRLRHGIQAFIDQRFYRRKYDAAKTLQALGVTLRGAVELNELSARMLMIVQETMQPAHLSLWLRPPAPPPTPAAPAWPQADSAAASAPPDEPS